MFFNQPRAKAYMRECGLDALIATSHVNITYFTGYFCWLDPTIRGYMLQPGAASSLARTGCWFPADGAVLHCDGRWLPRPGCPGAFPALPARTILNPRGARA